MLIIHSKYFSDSDCLKIPPLILYNQLTLTKFGRRFRYPVVLEIRVSQNLTKVRLIPAVTIKEKKPRKQKRNEKTRQAKQNQIKRNIPVYGRSKITLRLAILVGATRDANFHNLA